MDKTSKDGESTTERTSFTNQDGNFNSEDGSSNSSLTDSATTVGANYDLQTMSYSTHNGRPASTSTLSETSQLHEASTKNFRSDNPSLTSASNTPQFTGSSKSLYSGATFYRESSCSSTTQDGTRNDEDLLDETDGRQAALETTVDEGSKPLKNADGISGLDDADKKPVERLNICKRYSKFMFGGLVLLFVVVVVLVIVLYSK